MTVCLNFVTGEDKHTANKILINVIFSEILYKVPIQSQLQRGAAEDSCPWALLCDKGGSDQGWTPPWRSFPSSGTVGFSLCVPVHPTVTAQTAQQQQETIPSSSFQGISELSQPVRIPAGSLLRIYRPSLLKVLLYPNPPKDGRQNQKSLETLVMSRESSCVFILHLSLQHSCRAAVGSFGLQTPGQR